LCSVDDSDFEDRDEFQERSMEILIASSGIGGLMLALAVHVFACPLRVSRTATPTATRRGS
jgi:hypothetical protein